MLEGTSVDFYSSFSVIQTGLGELLASRSLSLHGSQQELGGSIDFVGRRTRSEAQPDRPTGNIIRNVHGS